MNGSIRPVPSGQIAPSAPHRDYKLPVAQAARGHSRRPRSHPAWFSSHAPPVPPRSRAATCDQRRVYPRALAQGPPRRLDTAPRSATPPLPARLRLQAPFGLPSFTPRALATASASFVRCEIASCSACATSAIMPTVRSFAYGMSKATNCAPLSRMAKRNAALRLSRSSFAITSVAPVTLARCKALASSGRSALRPLSTSVNRAGLSPCWDRDLHSASFSTAPRYIHQVHNCACHRTRRTQPFRAMIEAQRIPAAL